MRNAVGAATNSGNIALDGERTKIHEAAYGVLMDMLSNIYSNAARAVLREYSVNGWDEHKKFNVGRPVEVTLPSVLQPTLIIRDYGYAGLSREKVMDVFGTYGLSTKRTNDVEAGGFGIGSKAAFALGHQFMVTGYQDGEMFTALFTLNEDGTGTCTVLAEGPTQEQNGVEVSLGVDDIDGMRETAAEFFRFWERGEVLVDGQEPTPIWETLDKVNDEIYVDAEGRGEAFAVMGPVAYPVDRDILRKVAKHLEENDLGEAAGLPLRLIDSSTDVFLRVPIGSVKPAPSREALKDNSQTVQSLASVFLGLHQDSLVKIQAEVDAAPTYWEAVKAFEEGNESLGAFKVDRKAVTWKGQPMKKSLAFEALSFTLVTRSWRSETKIVGQERRITGFTYGEAKNTLVVAGVSEDQEGSVRRFVKRYLEENEDGVKRVIVVPAESVSFGWFQVGIERGARTINLDEWREILRGMRKRSPRTINEPSYTTGFTSASRDLEDRDLLSDIISEGKDIVIFHDTAARLSKFEKEVLADYTVVVLLGTQSEDALRKRVEADGAVQIAEWSTLKPLAKQAAQAVVDSMTDEEREAVAARAWIKAHSDRRATINRLLAALRHAGEVTSKGLVDVEDAFLLAEEFARPMSEARLAEVGVAQAAVDGQGYSTYGGLDPERLGIPAYEDDTVVDLSDRYPLLPVSNVVDAGRKIDRHTSEVTGEVFYDWSMTEESHKHALLLLDHALAYVNSH